MEIKDVLKRNLFIQELKSNDKENVLIELSNKLFIEGYIQDEAAFLQKLKDREAISTTGVGDGIAIPHAKSDDLKETVVLFGKSKLGVDFDSMDQMPSHFFFVIATPTDSGDAHLKVLASLSTSLMREKTQEELKSVKTYEDLLNVFSTKVDTSQKSEIDEEINNTQNKTMNIVAVTACATGIAHTYMAAEKLLEAGEKLGYRMRVETNGSAGAEHKLTQAEIDNADAVIIAADIHVDQNRFNGKKLLSVPVAQAIHRPAELIDEALKSQPYKGSEGQSKETKKSTGFYGHLLNGVSHMLPFVVGGGILIALGFLLDQLLGVPTESLGNLGSYNEWASYLNQIGGAAFGFMLPVLAGYIAMSIADRPGLVVGFVAGGIASAGGAGFLGALVGGFLAGYVMNAIKKVLKALPKNLDGIKTILLYPVLGILVVGGLMLLFNIPMSKINLAMNSFLEGLSGTNAAILGVILGTMMAIDLGGPVNKAAYLFATGTLASSTATGGSAVMAAVMAAGMVPPLATFVSTMFFKEKFNEEEKQAGLTNLVLGASFITEGAIPFASADPLRALPSFVVGSALTGALVMMSNILVKAPHGGIFVIFLISNPLLYLAYILAGSVLSGVILGFLKRQRS